MLPFFFCVLASSNQCRKMCVYTKPFHGELYSKTPKKVAKFPTDKLFRCHNHFFFRWLKEIRLEFLIFLTCIGEKTNVEIMWISICAHLYQDSLSIFILCVYFLSTGLRTLKLNKHRNTLMTDNSYHKQRVCLFFYIKIRPHICIMNFLVQVYLNIYNVCVSFICLHISGVH